MQALFQSDRAQADDMTTHDAARACFEGLERRTTGHVRKTAAFIVAPIASPASVTVASFTILGVKSLRLLQYSALQQSRYSYSISTYLCMLQWAPPRHLAGDKTSNSSNIFACKLVKM